RGPSRGLNERVQLHWCVCGRAWITSGSTRWSRAGGRRSADRRARPSKRMADRSLQSTPRGPPGLIGDTTLSGPEGRAVSSPDYGSRGSGPISVEPTPVRETISVIITAWRRRQFLSEALASVRIPPGSPIDLVVVSDFHNDDLEREVRSRQGK